ncbi:MAG TPA: FAD-dependent oxidoreductase, partial [Balneolaceae bacterium]|nr:FAD-dependent oxidoreductase [Balneolaceae bacterium]
IETEHPVSSLKDIPTAKTILFDLTPRQITEIIENKAPDSYLDKLKDFKYGPGVFKVDWALSEPVPWTNEHCRKAGTLHLGGTFDEISRAEQDA